MSLPVVDARASLVGVITIDDVLDVLEEGDDRLPASGARRGLTAPYLDTSVFTIFPQAHRLVLLLFITGTLTGSVLHLV